MALRSPLDADPRFTRHRSLRVLWPGMLVLAVGIAGLVLATVFMPALVAAAQREAEAASSTANASAARFDPLWTWLLAAGTALVGVFLLATSVERRHARTGHRLRRSLSASFAGGTGRMLELHRRFAGADPRRYRPLPETRNGVQGDTRLDIWDVPEEHVAYITISTGSGRSIRHAPLLRYEGIPYRELMTGIRDSRLRTPAPGAGAHGRSVRDALDPRVVAAAAANPDMAMRDEGDGLRLGGWEVDYLVRTDGDTWTVTPRDRGRDAAPITTNSRRLVEGVLLYHVGLPDQARRSVSERIFARRTSSGVATGKLDRGSRADWPDGSWAATISSYDLRLLDYVWSTPVEEMAEHGGGTLSGSGFLSASRSG